MVMFGKSLIMDDQLKHRDINWLSFNYRVLQEANDDRNPLFERLKFLAIFSSNLDEFFKVRVSQLRQIKKIDKVIRQRLSYKPNKTLKIILKTIKAHQEEFGRIYQSIIQELKNEGIQLLNREEVFNLNSQKVNRFFEESLSQYLKAVILSKEDKHPYFLSNEALYFIVDFGNEDRFGLVNIPDQHGRFLSLENPNDKTVSILFIDDCIASRVQILFPGESIEGIFEIKISRDAELYIEDEFEGELKDKIQESLSKRETGQATRLLYDQSMPKHVKQFLKNYLRLGKIDLMPGGTYHHLKHLLKFPKFSNQDLEYPVQSRLKHPLATTKSVFALIKEEDQLVHFPFMEFSGLERFVEEAATDDKVREIKISLYRVAQSSRLTSALVLALENYKKLTVFIEAKARFDEANNLKWGKILEDKGAHVIYSLPKIKIHSKILLVSRIENDITPVYYAYVGTGNFNADTSSMYTDHGLFTSKSELTNELYSIFQFIEGAHLIPNIEHLLVSPFNSRKRFEELIRFETHQALKGKPALIWAKMNSLEDEKLIHSLYEASQAGVKISLIVRGFCRLIPGIEGVSENIRVISIVDRYLEHGRIFRFFHDGQDKVFMGSADWMSRNLDKRIEVLTPVLDPKLKEEMIDILKIYLSDNQKARQIDENDSNTYVTKENGEDSIQAQKQVFNYLQGKLEIKNN